MFENPNLVERFLNYWRVTGHQRLGFLYGRYETHLDVPLGIKATVTAVYEPPQEGSRDHVKLLPDPKKELIDEVLIYPVIGCGGCCGVECYCWCFICCGGCGRDVAFVVVVGVVFHLMWLVVAMVGLSLVVV